MKKVILEEKSSEVYLSDLMATSIIGMETSHGNKFVLSKTNSGFECVGNNNLSSSGKTNYKSFKDALEGFENVFVFETTKELFKWMSE